MKALSGLLILVCALWLQTAFAQAPALKLGKAAGSYPLAQCFDVLEDRRYLEYVLFVSGMAIGQASLNGFANQFLWPQWPAWGNVALNELDAAVERAPSRQWRSIAPAATAAAAAAPPRSRRRARAPRRQ